MIGYNINVLRQTAWGSTQSRLRSLLSSLINSPGSDSYSTTVFYLDLSIDEMVGPDVASVVRPTEI